ncbi:hypothetical protein HMPREF0198_1941 [Cardiobacterium hominis ATCC 15826]|uniref:Uncharacterized protein n=1 Tax=Cardiobacterium hominis (strain ATCC 15826 / DSM 8339 / NCTC 10426 / 6573) TaxID=638300 RepID=C8NBR3_CARH6|nr:hypothetical protein HMPREF0198_1941 [Cardiobacterium hominis ATCC 15826]
MGARSYDTRNFFGFQMRTAVICTRCCIAESYLFVLILQVNDG